MGKNFFLSSVVFMLTACNSLFGETITGLWKSIDDKTAKSESVVAIYEHEGKFYGRIISTFDDNGMVKPPAEAAKNLAEGVKGNPPYVGLDIIWNLEKNGNKFTNGSILDPEKGKIYHAELSKENGNLIVHGEILVFGRNQTWVPATDNDLPPNFKKDEILKYTPTIPEVK